MPVWHGSVQGVGKLFVQRGQRVLREQQQQITIDTPVFDAVGNFDSKGALPLLGIVFQQVTHFYVPADDHGVSLAETDIQLVGNTGQTSAQQYAGYIHKQFKLH